MLYGRYTKHTQHAHPEYRFCLPNPTLVLCSIVIRCTIVGSMLQSPDNITTLLTSRTGRPARQLHSSHICFAATYGGHCCNWNELCARLWSDYHTQKHGSPRYKPAISSTLFQLTMMHYTSRSPFLSRSSPTKSTLVTR